MIRSSHTLFFLLLLVLAPNAAGNDALAPINDILDMDIFEGNWSAVHGDDSDQCRCEFPGQWYLITGIGTKTRDGDTSMQYGGCQWGECRAFKYDGDIGSFLVYNHSDWCEKIYHPYVITERVWNAQPQYTKDILNNTTKFMGVVPAPWYEWHPYMGRPDTTREHEISQHGHIFGWVDIAFENATIINGTRYVANECNIIPTSDIWNSVNGIKRYERCDDCESCKDMYAKLISMTENTTITETNDTITVTTRVVLKWGYYCWNCWPMNRPCCAMWRNTTEVATFTATAHRPEIIEVEPITNVSAKITIHNTSFDPYMIILVDVPETVVQTTYQYMNDTATQYFCIGCVEDSAVNYYDAPTWKVNSSVVFAYGASCIVRAHNISVSDLKIIVSTPYQSYIVTNYSITTIDREAVDYIDFKGIIIFVSLVGLCVLCVAMNLKRLL